MGNTPISAKTDPELRKRFNQFKDDFDCNQSEATRKLVDDGLRVNGYGPNGRVNSVLQSGLQAAGAVLVLFALGTFGFGVFAPPAIAAVTNPFAFLMTVSGAGFLFVSTVLEAARERRLPGIRGARRMRG